MECEPKSHFGNYGQKVGLLDLLTKSCCSVPVTQMRTWVASVVVGFVLSAGTACNRWNNLAAAADSRCGEGLVVTHARCCAPGQVVSNGHCVGKPSSCPSGSTVVESPVAGCVWISRPVHVQPGHYVVGPNDWESELVVATEGDVSSFWLDATEVTVADWTRCANAAVCAKAPIDQGRYAEPGLPMVNVSAGEAESFCRWAGGRLPVAQEWLRVTAGPNSRRFPWGQTGLVCRRASFGLVHGPCAEGGMSPDWVASRPDGRSELGLYDLVGNVAELVSDGAGGFELRGGSFRSDHAAELKTWSAIRYTGPGPDVGFRCAYDREPEAAKP